QGPRARGRPLRARRAAGAGEGALGVEGAVGLLQDRAPDRGGGGSPASLREQVPAGQELGRERPPRRESPGGAERRDAPGQTIRHASSKARRGFRGRSFFGAPSGSP